MEDSDLGFSQGEHHADEHAYQIGEIGEFEADESTGEEHIGGTHHAINEDRSVDFSEGEIVEKDDFSDLSRLSREADHSVSSYSSSESSFASPEDKNATSFLSSDYTGSGYSIEDPDRLHLEPTDHHEAEWERFVEEQN